MRPIILGIFAAFFFAITFVLNRAMELEGGSWIWSASLRFIIMAPLLFMIVWARGNAGRVFQEIKKAPYAWFIWSTVGFGLFYAPLCFAAAFGPGWLIAGTWQITIISGSLMAPLFYETVQTQAGPVQIRGKIPYKGLMMSLIILAGVALMQLEHAAQLSFQDMLYCVVPVIIASFAYPLGNRKMMEVCAGRLDAYQRVLGMTIASLPFWLILSLYGVMTAGPPGGGQVIQSGLVAVFSGICATVLFFAATDMVKGDMPKLAAVEATQSFEVLFAAAGEVWILSSPLPGAVSSAGIALVIIGMVLNSYVSNKKEAVKNEVLKA
ncbi:multidrug resistance efflux transporter family protein [Bacillus sonorensis]|uniref:DMT family transporter n=1 Tax=Bacillus sonorensis TaxID=119858 RepID=UPI002DBBE411|nr:multidrug resistance efflux transporter family protein [Bacillus sonorensis]MEC1356079.1 multidrug resistance efflux transporter family protein [Bacillus sonorensis]MEC1427703.1 multidrug resistance efflux transporter family protein [Bacillus sonorensis]